MAECKVCGAWFSSSNPVELCPACERALKRLDGYAVKVVYCWDCIYYREAQDWSGKAYMACYLHPDVCIFEKQPDDYCSYGERR